jgi:hypothetical protein
MNLEDEAAAELADMQVRLWLLSARLDRAKYKILADLKETLECLTPDSATTDLPPK